MGERQQPLIAWSIASYRDNQLLPTLQSGIYQAHFPSRLLPVVCWQGDLETPCCSCFSGCLSFPDTRQHTSHSQISAGPCACQTFYSSTQSRTHFPNNCETRCAALTSPPVAISVSSPLPPADGNIFLPPSSAAASAPASSAPSAVAHAAAACTARLSGGNLSLFRPSRHESSASLTSRAIQSHAYNDPIHAQRSHHSYTEEGLDRSNRDAGKILCACWCHALAAAPPGSGHAAVPQNQQQHYSVPENDTWSAQSDKNIQQKSKRWNTTGTADSETSAYAPRPTPEERRCIGAWGWGGIETAQLVVAEGHAAEDEEEEGPAEKGICAKPKAASAGLPTSFARAPKAAAASTIASGLPRAPASRAPPDAATVKAAAASRGAALSAGAAAACGTAASGVARGSGTSYLRGDRSEAMAAVEVYEEAGTVEKVLSVFAVSSRPRRGWATELHEAAKKTGNSGDSGIGGGGRVLSPGHNILKEREHFEEEQLDVKKRTILEKGECLAPQQSSDGCGCGGPSALPTKKNNVVETVNNESAKEEACNILKLEIHEAVRPRFRQETAGFVNPEAFSLLEVYAACWARSAAQQQKRSIIQSASALRTVSQREGVSDSTPTEHQNSWNTCSVGGEGGSSEMCAGGGRTQICSPGVECHMVDVNSKSSHFEKSSSFSQFSNSVADCSQVPLVNSISRCHIDSDEPFFRTRSAKDNKSCRKDSIRNTQCTRANFVALTPCPIAARASFAASPSPGPSPRSASTTAAAAATSGACSFSALLPYGVERASAARSGALRLPGNGSYLSNGSASISAPERVPPRVTSAAAAHFAVHQSAWKGSGPHSVKGLSGSERRTANCSAETTVPILQNQPLERVQHLLPTWVKQQLFAGADEDPCKKDSRGCYTLLCAEPKVTARFHLLSFVTPSMSLTDSTPSSDHERMKERQQRENATKATIPFAAQTRNGRSVDRLQVLRDCLLESDSGMCSARKCSCSCWASVCTKEGYFDFLNNSNNRTCSEEDSVRSRHACNNSCLFRCQEKCTCTRSSEAPYRGYPSNGPDFSGPSSTRTRSDNNTYGIPSSRCTARCNFGVGKRYSSSPEGCHSAAKLLDSAAGCCAHNSSFSQDNGSSPSSNCERSNNSRKESVTGTYEGEKLLQVAVMDLEGPCTIAHDDIVTLSTAAETLRLRFVFLDWSSSRGPCFARYICEQALPFASSSRRTDRGEMLLLQTDSHMRFAPHYDCFLVRQLFLAATAANKHRYNTSLVERATNRFAASQPETQKRRSFSKRSVDRKTIVETAAKFGTGHSAASPAGGGEDQAGQLTPAVQGEDFEKIWLDDHRRNQECSRRCAFHKHEPATTQGRREEAMATDGEKATHTRREASVKIGAASVNEEGTSAETENLGERLPFTNLSPSVSLRGRMRQRLKSYSYKENISYWDCCAHCGSCCDCQCSSCSCSCSKPQRGRGGGDLGVRSKKLMHLPGTQLPDVFLKKARHKYKYEHMHRSRKLLLRCFHKPLSSYIPQRICTRTSAMKLSCFRRRCYEKRIMTQERRRQSLRPKKQQGHSITFDTQRQVRPTKQQKRRMHVSSLPRVLLTAYPPGYDEAMPYYEWPKKLLGVEGSIRVQGTQVEMPATELTNNSQKEQQVIARDTVAARPVCTHPQHHGRREDIEEQPSQDGADGRSGPLERHAIAFTCACPASARRVKQTFSDVTGSIPFSSPPLLPPVLLCASRFDEKGILRITGRVLRRQETKGEGGYQVLLQQQQHQLQVGQLSPWRRTHVEETREAHQEHTHRPWTQEKNLSHCRQMQEELHSILEYAKEHEPAQTQGQFLHTEQDQMRQLDGQELEKQKLGWGGVGSLPLLTDASKTSNMLQNGKLEMLSGRGWMTSTDAVPIIALQGSRRREQEIPVQLGCCCRCQERALSPEGGKKGGDAEVFHLWSRRHRPSFRQELHQLHLNNLGRNRGKNNNDRSTCADRGDCSRHSSNTVGNDRTASSYSSCTSKKHGYTGTDGRRFLSKSITSVRPAGVPGYGNHSRYSVHCPLLQRWQQRDSNTQALSTCQHGILSDLTLKPSGLNVRRGESYTSHQQFDVMACTRKRYSLATAPSSACLPGTNPASSCTWKPVASSETQNLQMEGAADAGPVLVMDRPEEKKTPHSVPTENADSGYTECIYAQKQQNGREGSSMNWLLHSEECIPSTEVNVSCAGAGVRQDGAKRFDSAPEPQQQRDASLDRTEKRGQLQTAERYPNGDGRVARESANENPDHLSDIEGGMEHSRTEGESVSQERIGKLKHQASLAPECCCDMCCSRVVAELRIQNTFAADSRLHTRYELHQLCMGKKRNPQDFWKRAGIDWHSRTISLHALRGGLARDDAFEGAGPTAAAALNLVLHLLTKDGHPSLATADTKTCLNLIEQEGVRHNHR